ncbi:DUF4145 domain-containing protein [Streptomyces sp. NPDC047525]|uniref:DUF4145 domain-containing protein n=1 Tax=Streptomyces sp. NPDC047525 TaxID=3155264 RepID=UPI0033EA3704
MASTTCGWCGRLTHMTPVGDPSRMPGREYGNAVPYAQAFRCASEECRALSIGVGLVDRPSSVGTEVTRRLIEMKLEWLPAKVNRPAFPDVPEQIASTASEAHACLSIQAYRGAVALARAVVEATAKDKGVVKGPLVAKIDELAKQNLIREFTRELAHEIREGGNEIAHGDLGEEPMPPEDAQAIVSLMDEILQEVYQAPAKVLKLKQSRQAREGRNSK